MKEIQFVDVGEGITEGKVQKWLVKDGDQVKEDQPVVQVETDKAVVNAPSPITGKIKLNVKEGSIVHVGDILAYIGDESEIAAQPEQKPAEPKSAPTAKQFEAQLAPTPKPATHEIIATPYVRKLARDNSIDLSIVTGTGPGGRILENDIRNAINKSVAPQKQPAKFSELLEENHGDEVERVPMSQTRKAIAKNVELSLSIPTFTHMEKIDATKLYDVVTKEKDNAAQMGVKLTFLPFIIKATVEALKESPMANSSYDHERQEIIVKKYYNIGLAAEAPDGLKVVVVKQADKKSIIQIAKEIRILYVFCKGQAELYGLCAVDYAVVEY